MNNYLDTLECLQEERSNVRTMIYLRNSEPDKKIDLIFQMGNRKAYDLCQQYFAYSDKDLHDHIKVIDDEFNELLLFVSLEQVGLGNILKSLE